MAASVERQPFQTLLATSAPQVSSVERGPDPDFCRPHFICGHTALNPIFLMPCWGGCTAKRIPDLSAGDPSCAGRTGRVSGCFYFFNHLAEQEK